jgi:hypothetical protein
MQININCATCARSAPVRVERRHSSRVPSNLSATNAVRFSALLPEGWTFDDDARTRARCQLCSAKVRVLQLLEAVSTATALELLDELRAGVVARASEPKPTWDDDDEGTKVGIGPVLERRDRHPDGMDHGHTPPPPPPDEAEVQS